MSSTSLSTRKSSPLLAMDTPPTHPYPGPPPPAGVIPVPPNGHPVLQVLDPPAQSPNAVQPPIPVLPESQAATPLAQSYNVRTMVPNNWPGQNFKPQSLGRAKLTVYRQMSIPKWNTARVINDETNDLFLGLVTLLRNIWLSVYHHQEQLVIGGVCAVYALPRARLGVWRQVIPVLLAAFQVQLYMEDNSPQAPQISIWGDFSQSSRPHIDELAGAVTSALAVAVWYSPF